MEASVLDREAYVRCSVERTTYKNEHEIMHAQLQINKVEGINLNL